MFKKIVLSCVTLKLINVIWYYITQSQMQYEMSKYMNEILRKKYYMKENKKRKGIKRQGEKRVWFRLIQIKLNTMHIVTAPKYISIIYFLFLFCNFYSYPFILILNLISFITMHWSVSNGKSIRNVIFAIPNFFILPSHPYFLFR